MRSCRQISDDWTGCYHVTTARRSTCNCRAPCACLRSPCGVDALVGRALESSRSRIDRLIRWRLVMAAEAGPLRYARLISLLRNPSPSQAPSWSSVHSLSPDRVRSSPASLPLSSHPALLFSRFAPLYHAHLPRVIVHLASYTFQSVNSLPIKPPQWPLPPPPPSREYCRQSRGTRQLARPHAFTPLPFALQLF